MAQLYEQEFKTQEKAKYEHIRQAKEKALEEQRVEAERIERENSNKSEQDDIKSTQGISGGTSMPNTATSGTIGSDWSSVSPEQASEYLASKTGVSASKWQAIIYAESTNNPTVTNSIGCFGYLQLHPVHGNVSIMTPQQYLDTAVSVYNSQGLSAWQVTTNGMVN